MQALNVIIDDGGRSKYFKAPRVGDCVTRAIAIATQRDYKEVYDDLFRLSGESPRDGVKKSAIKKYMNAIGWEFIPLMKIGSGCKAHLAEGEVPMDERIICSVSGHYVAVIYGEVHDTYDSTREGQRCVYGYWHKPDTSLLDTFFK